MQDRVNEAAKKDRRPEPGAGFERDPKAKFTEAPVAVAAGDQGGDGRGDFRAVAVGFAVDTLLPASAVKAFDAAVGLGSPTRAKRGVKV